MSKRSFRISYRAEKLGGYNSLVLFGDDTKTPEKVRAAIDRTNKNAKLHDYEVEQYSIIRETVQTVRDDDGRFICRSCFDSVIEVYPAEPDKTLRFYVMYYQPSKYGCLCEMSTYHMDKAIDCCKRMPGTYVKDNTGRIIITNQ